MLGHDVAGVVTRVGSAVRGFEVGDQVHARPRDLRIGGFAEFIATDVDDVTPKPAPPTPQGAAAVPLVALAARQPGSPAARQPGSPAARPILVGRARVKPGQKVPIHRCR